VNPGRMVSMLGCALAITLASSAQTNFQVLHNFGDSNDGMHPSGALSLDKNGRLYGGTGGGPGEYGNGTVYTLTRRANGSWKEIILHSFAGGTDGADPRGNLVLDAGGNLYGTANGNGGAAIGGVFQLSPGPGPQDWANTILYTNGFVGEGPGLLIGNGDTLYGQMGPGQDKVGAIGELSTDSSGWDYTQLYSFCSGNSCPDGVDLPTPPIWDGRGNMYGVTIDGGIGPPMCFSTTGCGVIYRMIPNSQSTWTYQVLHCFASSAMDGEWPYGGLVMDAAGNFYGSTWLGGKYNHGTVFKFRSNGWDVWEETPIYDFPNCLQGCMVEGTLAMDQAGNLYGTAAGGTGSCGGAACGVIFELSPQPNGQWKYTVLHYLNATDGGVQPFYGVTLDDKGNLFGVTSSFGEYGGGTAFEITP
jgi:hypothetical protein